MDLIGDQTGQMMDLTTPGIQEGMTITKEGKSSSKLLIKYHLLPSSTQRMEYPSENGSTRCRCGFWSTKSQMNPRCPKQQCCWKDMLLAGGWDLTKMDDNCEIGENSTGISTNNSPPSMKVAEPGTNCSDSDKPHLLLTMTRLSQSWCFKSKTSHPQKPSTGLGKD